MEHIQLEANGVRLRDWSIADLEPYEHWLQPGHRWQELDGPYYKKVTTEEIPGILERVRTRLETRSLADPRNNFIIAESRYNSMIGQVTRYWISEETLWLAAGIVIYDPSLWGRGYGYSALGLWTDYLFQAFPAIVRLDLQTWSGNTGMMRLAEKLGYMLEGRFRQARIVAGEHYDALGYGILRTEWQELHPQGFRHLS
jgi:putative hydrolase of HD superfamily